MVSFLSMERGRKMITAYKDNVYECYQLKSKQNTNKEIKAMLGVLLFLFIALRKAFIEPLRSKGR